MVTKNKEEMMKEPTCQLTQRRDALGHENEQANREAEEAEELWPDYTSAL